jgi:nucleoside-diphosphate-sugar epimerase
MRHLITGAAGFIGSHLADALLADGEEVDGVDDFHLGTPAHIDWARRQRGFSFVEADISDGRRAYVAFRQLAEDRVPNIDELAAEAVR